MNGDFQNNSAHMIGRNTAEVSVAAVIHAEPKDTQLRITRPDNSTAIYPPHILLTDDRETTYRLDGKWFTTPGTYKFELISSGSNNVHRQWMVHATRALSTTETKRDGITYTPQTLKDTQNDCGLCS